METGGSERGKNKIKGPGVFMCKVCVSISQEEVRLQRYGTAQRPYFSLLGLGNHCKSCTNLQSDLIKGLQIISLDAIFEYLVGEKSGERVLRWTLPKSGEKRRQM